MIGLAPGNTPVCYCRCNQGLSCNNTVFPKPWLPCNERIPAYRYPLQLESLVLFWNRRLLAAAPTDVRQFPQLASDLAKDMDKDMDKDVDLVGWDFSSPYHSWPFVTAGVAKALHVDAAGQLRMQAQTAQTALTCKR